MVRLSIRSLFLHELINQLVGWRMLQINTHDQEQSPEQSTRSAFGNATAAHIYLVRLIRLSINFRKGDQGLFRMKSAYIANFGYKLRTKHRTDTKHLHHNWVFR